MTNLTSAALAPVVRRALRERTAVPLAWRCSPIGYATYYRGRALYRVEGTADVRGAAVPWSVVLKTVETPDLTREVRFYRSRLSSQLPQGLAAPRLLHVERQGSTLLLWLERIQGSHGIYLVDRFK